MKKYIFAAVIALLGFSSCRLSDSGIRDYNKVPRMIYEKMYNACLYGYIKEMDFVVLTDMLMAGDEQLAAKIRKQYMVNVAVEDGVYYFDMGYSNTYYVATDSRPLDEGGEWKVGIISEYASKMIEHAAVEGNANKAGQFTMTYAKRYAQPLEYTTDERKGFITSDFVVEQSSEGFVITHNATTTATYNCKKEGGDVWNPAENYCIEWFSIEPFVISNGTMIRLAVDIHYHNLADGTGYHVAAYVNGSEKTYERYPYQPIIPAQ